MHQYRVRNLVATEILTQLQLLQENRESELNDTLIEHTSSAIFNLSESNAPKDKERLVKIATLSEPSDDDAIQQPDGTR